ncbi:tRNA-splicing endonuclease subunit Sen54 [Galdieria sulphuraria]|uniref:tRNA-splicing endonuclease subunit Sen54 isoform 1 n=1 Tax=Galdieria sulphuraria TaxID=130081 RepID=M2VXT0_GALSU|nr:tRNA-splicing endonuclease subunit Sen54 isoform 1 [Galdieria sulphuraria]EME28096.1 tRNA-splicing endonuclease subunit Sen54 isoform 1 [Galdieria sulphuraria]GJD12132.1 tRNA-splicing endonuclease subunit Sen54 [Galdieria sulphuraria]|eukprot:XP_005704616.1 tRNA-splicing endonuclease subunit Sen54 isoform 1 [Galdieria sulphuraria]
MTRAGGHRGILPKRGKKEQLLKPGNIDTKQRKKIEKRRRKLFSTLFSEKRVQRRNLAVATWDAERLEAMVKVPKGKIFQTLGYFESSKQYLDPLEVLFLVDIGILQLQVGETTASVQLAYQLAVEAGVDWNAFLVYAHLRRLGFIVRKSYRNELQLPYSVNFDVWKPGTWKRRIVRNPYFYCIVCSFLDRPLIWEQVQMVCRRLSPIGVRLATVERSAVTFFDCSDGSLWSKVEEI